MQDKDLAPVALFAYNRPNHTARAIESLKQNKLSEQTILYVIADGPKLNAGELEKENIAKTRELIKKITGFKELIVIEKEKNEGLAQSIITGVTEITNRHGKIIVLEDDLLVSPYFLDFMNEGLEVYASSKNVYSVNGFMFPLKHRPETDVVLLPYTSTWGWATWKNKWQDFDPQMKGKELLLSDKKLAAKFNVVDYKYTNMLHFGNNSWGIKWYYSVFMKKGLNLFPTHTLVINNGFDGSGTNCEDDGHATGITFSTNKPAITFIENIDPQFYKKYVNYFRKKSLIQKVIEFLKS